MRKLHGTESQLALPTARLALLIEQEVQRRVLEEVVAMEAQRHHHPPQDAYCGGVRVLRYRLDP